MVVVRRLAMRKTWFTDGARALRAELCARGQEEQLPTGEDWYTCPLCLNIVFRIGVLDEPDPMLTIEHAPPEWSGGAAMALTCKPCNSESGRLFDAEAQKEQFLRAFAAGRSAEPVRAAFTVDGVTTYVDWHMTGTTGMWLSGIPKANNPADLGRLVAAMDRHVGPDAPEFSMQLMPRQRVNRDRARVSWIRAAYIIAFARFGWNYVFQNALEPMRRHFKDPTSATLPILSMTDPGADPARRELWLIKEPIAQQCIMVVMGQQRVLLPLPADPRSLEDLSTAWVGDHDLTQPAQFSYTGTLLHWPDKPSYSFDAHPTPQIPAPAAAADST
jgi:hypothetical protein